MDLDWKKATIHSTSFITPHYNFTLLFLEFDLAIHISCIMLLIKFQTTEYLINNCKY